MHGNSHRSATNSVVLPRPTVWPFVMALGITLAVAGLVTDAAVSILGLVLFFASAVGWFLQLFPHEAHEAVPIAETEAYRPVTQRTLPARPHAAVEAVGEAPRKVLPIETFHITTGIRGGIAGGIAMVLPAGIFSLVKYHSIWYAANLLAAGGFVSWAGASDVFLSQFHWQGLLAAIGIHAITSLLVGLLYGAMLPMYPRYPILTAGLMVPLIFSGIQYSALGIVSPILDQRIDWFWFVVSQVAFGLVCGYVVNLTAKVRTPQFRALPFAVRAGLHGAEPHQPEEGDHSK
ncbi:MAG TPA: hypothetical protein VN682_04870 [Terriglobales bacterium]|nr:hypothetical protein [Terriglobales bacterium]